MVALVVALVGVGASGIGGFLALQWRLVMGLSEGRMDICFPEAYPEARALFRELAAGVQGRWHSTRLEACALRASRFDYGLVVCRASGDSTPTSGGDDRSSRY
jgi:hypothetical protein